MDAVGIVVVFDVNNLVKYFLILISSKGRGQPVADCYRILRQIIDRAPAAIASMFFIASSVVITAFDDNRNDLFGMREWL